MYGTNVSCIDLVRYKKNNLKIVLYYNSNYVITNTLITDYHTLVPATSTTIMIIIIIISFALQPSAGYGLLVTRGFLITHDRPQSVGLLWMSDQLVA
jgi:hypothetical protein